MKYNFEISRFYNEYKKVFNVMWNIFSIYIMPSLQLHSQNLNYKFSLTKEKYKKTLNFYLIKSSSNKNEISI